MKHAKTLKWLLTFACLLAALCAFTLAANAEIVDSGTCGDNLTWTLDDTGTLTISGTGEMDDYINSFWYGYTSAPWFWNESNKLRIKTVVIKNGVTSIGNRAFYGSSALTSVFIPDSVASIGNDAFCHCTGLTSVTIPDSVTSIGDSAFRVCTGLTTVAISDSVTSIAEYTFSGCTGLTSVTIPRSVTSIGWNAFSVCTGLTSVTIPDSVMSIESCAFASCTGLTLVTLGNGMTSIGYMAFEGCIGLTSVTIPDSVKVIRERAFGNCTGLKSVTLGKGIPSIEKQAFYCCTGLTKVNIGNLSSWCEIAFGDGASNPLVYAHHLFLNGKEVTNLIIPDSVTSIGGYAFIGCTGLKTVKIPDSVTSIGGHAFRGCTGLKTVKIPDSVTSIENYTFSGCTWLTSVIIPDSVTNIGYMAFIECTGLKSVTIPDSVTSIGGEAFSNCTNLTSLMVGNGIKRIEEKAFIHCTELAKVNIDSLSLWCSIEFESPESNPLYYAHHLFLNGEEVTNLIIPDSVSRIGDYAFAGCSGLTSVTIPDSVTSIGHSTFEYCTGLTAVTIPNSVASIAAGAFSYCTGLTKVIIDSLSFWVSIEFDSFLSNPLYYAPHLFLNGKEVTNLIIPDSVSRIGDYAFARYAGLTSVTIPDSVTSIGNSAFSGCTGLTSVTIPDSVTCIGNGAFSGCAGLTSVTIPDSVTSIGDSAFSGCTGLTSITIPDSVTSIGHSVFRDCTELTSVTIQDSVTSIGDSAFSGCTGLTSITIPDSVTYIGYYAFSGCTGLTDVYYGGSEEQWESMYIDYENECLLSATIHYNSVDESDLQPLQRERINKNVTYSYDLDEKTSAKDKKTTIQIMFDSDWFNYSSQGYQHELAQFCSQVVTVGYARKAQLITALKNLNFKVEEKDVNLSTGREEVNYFIASKPIYANNQEKTLVFCGFIGSHHLQWNSNFDPYGTDRSEKSDPKYFAVSEKGTVHLGFEDAKRFVMKKLDDYFLEHDFPASQVKLLVTGHSRGAAVANLVAADLIRGSMDVPGYREYCDADDVYTYTFATPNNVKKSAFPDFDNDCFDRIFNIVNPQDFVTYVLPKDWGFSKYGTTFLLPTIDNVGKSLYSEFNLSMRQYFSKVKPGTTFEDYDFGEKTTYKIVKKFANTIGSLDDFYEEKLFAYNADASEPSVPVFYSPFEYFQKVLCPFVNKEDSKFSAGVLAAKILRSEVAQLGLFSRLTGYFIANGTDLHQNFGHSHCVETYCSYLMTMDSRWVTEEKGSKYYKVDCPVDIEIYDNATGELLGRTVNNVVDEAVAAGENAVVIDVEGDEKSFILPDMLGFNIKYIGYDKGTMDLSISTVDNDLTETERINFFNVPLEKGMVYDSSMESDAALDDYVLITEDEEPIRPDESFDPQEAERFTVTTACEGGRLSDSSVQSAVSGDYVTVFPVLTECEAFHGWYEGDNLVSAEPVYRFRPTGDIVLTGKVSMEHTVEEIVTEPTCTEDGETKYFCSVCGEEVKDPTAIQATGHSYGAWEKLNDAQHQRVCANDGSHIEKADHAWDDGSIKKTASCTEDGEMTFTCIDCHATKTETIPATGEHHFGDWAVTKEATVDAEGKESRTCSVCGEKETRAVPPLAPVEPTFTPGDADGDGKLTSADARLALRASVGLKEPGDVEKDSAGYLACDVDSDGKVTSADARLILRASVGLEDAGKFGKRQ